MRLSVFTITAVALAGLIVQAATAGPLCGGCRGAGCDQCCEQECGCECGTECGKICKLVCTTRTIKAIAYAFECDSVCIPGPSEKGCRHCDTVTDGKECDCECGQSPMAIFRWTDWNPGCAEVRDRKKLVKYEATKEVCSFKWEVVDGCAAQEADVTKPAPEQAKVGDELPLSEAEIQQVSANMPAKNPAPKKAIPPAPKAEPAPLPEWSMFKVAR